MEYKYTDTNDTPVALSLTVGEIKRIVRALRAVPEDHTEHFFASYTARDLAGMVRMAGDQFHIQSDEFTKFDRSDD